jgi:5-methylcytosine-specific restriction endonuclease McrA
MAQILGGQQPQQPKIDLSQAQDLNCLHCGGEYFINAVMVKKISKFVTGTANDAVLPVDVLLCGNCGKPLEDLLPKEFRKHTPQVEPTNEEPTQDSSISLEL